jgi:hypothetical protein
MGKVNGLWHAEAQTPDTKRQPGTEPRGQPQRIQNGSTSLDPIVLGELNSVWGCPSRR